MSWSNRSALTRWRFRIQWKSMYSGSEDEAGTCLFNPLLSLSLSLLWCRFDEKINNGTRYTLRGSKSSLKSSRSLENLPKSAQFGVSLRFIIENSACLNCIPPIVRKCVDHLSLPDGKCVCVCAVFIKESDRLSLPWVMGCTYGRDDATSVFNFRFYRRIRGCIIHFVESVCVWMD